VVQLENVRVEGVHARDESGFTDNHPDVLQTWAGPAELRVDRLSGSTDYQGFFLAPNEFGSQPPPRQCCSPASTCEGRIAARLPALAGGIVPDSPRRRLGDTPSAHDPVALALSHTHGVERCEEGSPPVGQFVPAGVAGSSYISPGYR